MRLRISAMLDCWRLTLSRAASTSSQLGYSTAKAGFSLTAMEPLMSMSAAATEAMRAVRRGRRSARRASVVSLMAPPNRAMVSRISPT